ncbi:MAG: hypothetical protein AAF447_22240, partial [Myxococcota bacterium]
KGPPMTEASLRAEPGPLAAARIAGIESFIARVGPRNQMLVKITTEDVETLLYRRDVKAYALFVMNIARELSRRLRVADGILAQFVSTVADTYGSGGDGAA